MNVISNDDIFAILSFLLTETTLLEQFKALKICSNLFIPKHCLSKSIPRSTLNKHNLKKFRNSSIEILIKFFERLFFVFGRFNYFSFLYIY